jgi:hypothetical protein
LVLSVILPISTPSDKPFLSEHVELAAAANRPLINVITAGVANKAPLVNLRLPCEGAATCSERVVSSTPEESLSC